jgi:chromosome partitioning protein
MAKKAKIIAVYSLKGGVGKTSLAVNLAAEAAAQLTHSKSKTLLWDLDPQAAASYILGRDDKHMDGKKAFAHSIFEKGGGAEKLAMKTPVPGLDLLPADRSLRELDRTLASLGKKRRLQKLVADLMNDYDRIILDCPPGLTETSEQVIRAADLILVPVIPSKLSRRALDEVVSHIKREHKGNAALLPIFSMVDRRRSLHQAALMTEPAWPMIPMASAVEQMAEQRLPVRMFAPNSVAGKAFAKLWQGVDAKRNEERRVLS